MARVSIPEMRRHGYDAAFAAGAVSFLSPCVLPLVPGLVPGYV